MVMSSHANLSAKVITVLPVIMVAGWMATRREGPWTLMRILGLLLIMVGLGFLTLARCQLERQPGLVTRGLYRHLRHPIYVFSMVAFAGLLFYLNEPRGIPLLLVMGFFPVWLGRREERDMEAIYGDRYRRYRRHTWF
jgi:protein-S-isoprenylcysteine O-methyltransferase Ste14